MASEMSSRHYISVFTKLESYRGAGERVTELLQKILTNGENKNNFLVAMHDAQRKDLSSFASRTAVIVIDARQTRTLFTPSRRDANVDHWDELDQLTYSFTYPKGSVFLLIYGDEKSKCLEDRALMADGWLKTWRFNDDVAYSLANRRRCITIWDKFSKGQAEFLQDFFRNWIPLYTFYENQLTKSVMQRNYLYRFLQKCNCIIRRISTSQSILVVGIDEIPENLHEYFQLNPFLSIVTEKSDKIQLTQFKSSKFRRPNQGEIVNVYQAKLSVEPSHHYGDPPNILVKKFEQETVDLLKFRIEKGIPCAAGTIIKFIRMPVSTWICNQIVSLGLKIIRLMGIMKWIEWLLDYGLWAFGLLTYDALLMVTNSEDDFIDVHKREENTRAFKNVRLLHFNGNVIPAVSDDSISSDSVLMEIERYNSEIKYGREERQPVGRHPIQKVARKDNITSPDVLETKLDEYISETENVREFDKKHPRVGISAVFHRIQFLFFTVINFICLLFSNTKPSIVDKCHEMNLDIFHYPACQKFIQVTEYIAWIIFVIPHYIVVYSLVVWHLGKIIMSLLKPYIAQFRRICMQSISFLKQAMIKC